MKYTFGRLCCRVLALCFAMFRGLIVFGTGVYTGVYIAQNYEIKKVEDPATVLNRVVKWVDDKAKENEKK